MDRNKLREKLHEYIDKASERKLEAIFTIVEDEMNEDYSHWNDEAFVNELERREKSYLTGFQRTFTADQAAARAREAIKQVHK